MSVAVVVKRVCRSNPLVTTECGTSVLAEYRINPFFCGVRSRSILRSYHTAFTTRSGGVNAV